MELEVLSVNISEKKGTVKESGPFIELYEKGVRGDAHSGSWHRQVSLLGVESIEKFSKQNKKKIRFGEFAENITTRATELHHLRPFDRLENRDVELEITQIGKKCHGDNCAIFREVGNCVMPMEGIFARVKKGGLLKPGHKFNYIPKVFKCKVITLSDRAFRDEYEDKSGPFVMNMLEGFFKDKKYPVEILPEILPDEESMIVEALNNSVKDGFDIIITTGGTGIAPRDVTPEAVRKVIDKEIPGIMELVRVKYGMEKPGALLSRSVAGTKNKTLIYALPGSPKAVKEYMDEILKTLMHLFRMLYGIDSH